MNSELFTVFDSAAGRYLDVFTAPSKEFAIREFKSAVNKEGHQFNLYPSDYTLYYIADFNAETGIINGHDPFSLGVAATFFDRLDTGAEA